jgi:Mn2+/Fe2+ NRAMP family transporter
MYLDAWVSMIVFTISTVSFYFMGAAVLHPQGLHPEGKDMILTLSRMFVDSFGSWTQIVFLVGAGAVLFKTLYLSSAGNARLAADFFTLAGFVRYTEPKQRARVIHGVSLLIPVIALMLFLAFKEPRWMVVVGGFGQALTLPMITAATIYLRYRKLDRRLTPPMFLDIMLWIAFVSITLVAIYALRDQAMKFMGTVPGK